LVSLNKALFLGGVGGTLRFPRKKTFFLPKPTLEVYSIKISRYFAAKSFGLSPPPKNPRDFCGVWCKKLGLEVNVGRFVKHIPGTQMTLLLRFEKGLVLRG